jgi:Rad3-related DNA helicase
MLDNGKGSMRLTGSLRSGEALIESLKKFFPLRDFATEEIPDERLKVEFDIARGRLFVDLQNLTDGIYQQKSNFVYWIEKSEDDLLGNIHIKGQPIEVSDIMNKQVNQPYGSAIYVSATLAVGSDFSFTERKLGMERHKNLLLSSPFEY